MGQTELEGEETVVKMTYDDSAIYFAAYIHDDPSKIITGEDHRSVTVEAPHDAILIVDSVFALRPEYAEFWDRTIWLDVSPTVSLERGVGRDADREGYDEAVALHRDRYHASELIYLAEVDPAATADVVIDNTDFAAPVRRR